MQITLVGNQAHVSGATQGMKIADAFFLPFFFNWGSDQSAISKGPNRKIINEGFDQQAVALGIGKLLIKILFISRNKLSSTIQAVFINWKQEVKFLLGILCRLEAQSAFLFLEASLETKLTCKNNQIHWEPLAGDHNGANKLQMRIPVGVIKKNNQFH